MVLPSKEAYSNMIKTFLVMKRMLQGIKCRLRTIRRDINPLTWKFL